MSWGAVSNSGFETTAAAESFAAVVREVLGCETVVEPLRVNGQNTSWTVVRVAPYAMKRANDLRTAFDAGRRLP